MIPPDIRWAVALLFGAPVSAILAGFFLFRPRRPEWTHWPVLASCAAVTAAAMALLAFAAAGRGFDQPLWTWALAGDWGVSFGLRIDGPGAVVLAMVATVGSLVHLYAAAYMKGDPGFSRFFLVFHLFFLAMIGLLTANDFVQLYLFWELVGVASYLLVGFWWSKDASRRAALKAFLTNRLGDLGFLGAVLLLLATLKTSRLQLVYLAVAARPTELLSLVGLGLVWAACAKSAQWPLYWWLPDAMEGPTPASALMHAATMVTAGVFLLVRSWPIVAAVEGLPELVAWLGAFTALSAAVLAGTKTDMKRSLAYSTASHLGLMMLALGLGHVGAALFHLVTHGFFKAALFLCAGNAAHALGKPTVSLDEAGGLRRAMPLTYACFWIAALSLAGVWPLGGFFSKDAILDAAWHRGGALAAAGLLTAAASAFYAFRLLFLVFHGARPEQGGGAAHAHEAGPAFAAPVAALCAGAALSGLLGPLVERALRSGWTLVPRGLPAMPGDISIPHPAPGTALLGLAMTAAGAAAAWWLTMADPGWDWRWRARAPRLAAWAAADFGWIPLCDGAGRAVARLARLLGRTVDKAWWDGLLEGTAVAARGAGAAASGLTAGRLGDALWWTAAGAALLAAGALR